MPKIHENEAVSTAIAMIVAASMQDKPIHIAKIQAHCDDRHPEELIAVLDEAAFYGVEVLTK